jgi:hypothetical protein
MTSVAFLKLTAHPFFLIWLSLSFCPALPKTDNQRTLAICDDNGNVIDTYEHAGDCKEW